MDDALVARWRDGDAKASTAIRNAIRSTAERVLSHPALDGVLGPQAAMELQDDDRRRDLTARLAQEVMRRQAANAAQVKALAIMAASRHAVEAMQSAWPKTDDAHLPAQVTVSMALAPGGLAPRVREAAERHLEGCKRCAGAIHVVDRIVRTQEATVQDTRREDLVAEAARAEAQAAEESRQRAREARRRRAEAKADKKEPKPSPRRRPDRDAQKKGMPAWVFAVVAVAVVGAGVWYWMSRGGGPAGPSGPVPGVVALADQSPPEVGRLADLPPDVQFAVGDLANGDCRTAAGRFRSARAQAPDKGRLYVLEAGAFVCAGDSRKAQRALDDLDGMIAEKGGSVPRSASWFRAQAQLLEGDAGGALVSLSDARINDPKHRQKAAEQTKAIEALLR
jgi:hypothetical protein